MDATYIVDKNGDQWEACLAEDGDYGNGDLKIATYASSCCWTYETGRGETADAAIADLEAKLRAVKQHGR